MSLIGSRDSHKRNGSGYVDPTSYVAIKSADSPSIEESDRFHDLLDALHYIVGVAGFEIQGRIVLKDKKTKRVWR